MVSPSPDFVLAYDDRLTVIGQATAVDEFNQEASAN